MDAAAREAFLARPNTSVIATVDANGRAHAVPVWYRWDGSVFAILTGRKSAKHRNIQRTGRASLCIDQRDGRFVSLTAEGPVTVGDVVTHDDRLSLYTHYVGAERAGQFVKAGSPEHEGMVMLYLTPERWLGYGD